MIYDLYDCDEIEKGIHHALMKCLEKYDLSTGRVPAYAADNANVNVGKQNAVY